MKTPGGPPIMPRANAVRLKTAKSKSPASQRWLGRQLNDPYVKAAVAAGYRSRAAFKLIEIDDKFGLIKPRSRVVDLGAAPGGWTQIALRRGAATVVGIDLLDIPPIEGAQFLKGDFNDPGLAVALAALLGGPAELVLSDMAPNTTGHASTDHIRIIALAELALDFAARTLVPGGAFVAKVFQGGSERQMLEPMKRLFATVRHAKPPASRKDSSELYVVATGFRGGGRGSRQTSGGRSSAVGVGDDPGRNAGCKTMIGRLLVLALLAWPGPVGAAEAPVVTVAGGMLRGAAAGGVAAYLGIPYAATTAGANRWRAPQPAPAWHGMRAAQDFGPNCAQTPPFWGPGLPWTAEYLASGPQSEDCLSLNVWAPSSTGSKRPVLVFIHGGAYVGGSGSIPVYRGTSLAARGIVVVTINYRLGVFGFLDTPMLTAEGPGAGNYGLLDQQAALAWLRDNIAAFGGDPARVTIAGQSAGAGSVLDLMAMPTARGLFRQSIVESGVAVPRSLDVAVARQTGAAYIKLLGVSDPAALRALPARRLLDAAASFHPTGKLIPFSPVADGAILPTPATPRADIPLLTGYNADEGSAGDPVWNTASPADLMAAIKQRFGAFAARFAPLYQPGAGSSARTLARTMLSDQAISAILALSENQPSKSAPVYAYLFTHVEPGTDAAKFGTFHTAEIPYVFDALGVGGRNFTTTDHAIARRMGDYWINFVRTGNPNGPGLPVWPTVAAGGLMQLGDRFAARPILSPAKRAAFDAWLKAGNQPTLF